MYIYLGQRSLLCLPDLSLNGFLDSFGDQGQEIAHRKSTPQDIVHFSGICQWLVRGVLPMDFCACPR